MNDYLNAIRNNYANFTGRARRREYWMFTLVNTIISFLLYLLVAVFAIPSLLASQDSGNITPTPLILLGIYMIYILAILVPGLAISVRRLHDAGYSGWMFLVTFVPIIGSIGLLVLMVQDSKPGDNKWGPNPEGLSEVRPAF